MNRFTTMILLIALISLAGAYDSLEQEEKITYELLPGFKHDNSKNDNAWFLNLKDIGNEAKRLYLDEKITKDFFNEFENEKYFNFENAVNNEKNIMIQYFLQVRPAVRAKVQELALAQKIIYNEKGDKMYWNNEPMKYEDFVKTFRNANSDTFSYKAKHRRSMVPMKLCMKKGPYSVYYKHGVKPVFALQAKKNQNDSDRREDDRRTRTFF